jgi:hypothetical protein
MTAFKKGDVVKVKVVVPQGPVTKLRMDEDGTIWYLVEWTNTDGTPAERWFTEDQIETAG